MVKQTDIANDAPYGHLKLHYPCDVHTFVDPPGLMPSSLAKLAPALDPSLACFAVEPTADNTSDRIWGTLSYEPMDSLFNPMFFDGVRTFGRPDYPTVAAVGKGSLLICRRGVVLGRIIDGYFEASRPTAFNQDALGPWIDRVLERRPYYGPLFPIQELVDELSRRTHGALLVLLPPSMEFPSDYVGYRRELRGKSDLWDELNEFTERHQEAGPIPLWSLRNQIMHRISRLSQLAAIDGALIATGRLKPIAFGAQLKAPEWLGRCEIGPYTHVPRDSKETFPITSYGLRHRTALNFAGACPEAVVLTVSQDGPVRAFAKSTDDPDLVFCWPDCTSYLD
jgi:hypothetical protein